MKDVIAKNLKRVMSQRGKSGYQLALDTGVREPHISRILHEKHLPSLATLGKLAEGLDVPIVALLGYETIPPLEYKIIVSDKVVRGKDVQGYIAVPILTDPKTLHPDLRITRENTKRVILVDPVHIKKGAVHQGFHATDNSMSPIIEKGNTVIVDVKQRDPVKLNGSLIVCLRDNGNVVVRQCLVVDVQIYLKAENVNCKSLRGPLIMPQRKEEILGRVVWVWRQFE